MKIKKEKSKNYSTCKPSRALMSTTTSKSIHIIYAYKPRYYIHHSFFQKLTKAFFFLRVSLFEERLYSRLSLDLLNTLHLVDNWNQVYYGYCANISIQTLLSIKLFSLPKSHKS